MNERTWERFGASTGIAFFVLLVASVVILPAPPKATAAVSTISG